MEYLSIGLGGVLGALSRYSVSKWIGQRWPGTFPVATLGINLAGSFMLGFLYIFFSNKTSPSFIRSFVTSGFLGAFTTYSTFSLEIINLTGQGEKGTAVRYFALSVCLGILAAYAGMILGDTVNL